MEQNNRKLISIIAFLRKFIVIFFSLFFNIYILKIVDNDLNFILKYTIYSVILVVVFEYIILKKINSKNVQKIFIISFPLLTLCFVLLLVFKENIVKHIYLFKTLHTLSFVCYAAPQELIIIGSSSDKKMSSFLANLNILENLTAVIAPFLSGFIIDKLSYNIFFILLFVETLIIIFISFKIKNFTINDKKMNVREYLDKVKNKEHLNSIYKCMFFRRISSQGAIVELLPIVLFLRLGTELELGSYNALFAIISIISLQILKIVNNKNIRKTFYPYLAISIFVSSLILVFNASFISLIIYYVLMYSFGMVIESESCSYIYSSIKKDGFEKYKKEHIMVFNIYMAIGQIISYTLVYVLYNYFYNVNILSIAISALMFFLIVSTIYLRKTQDYMERKM